MSRTRSDASVERRDAVEAMVRSAKTILSDEPFGRAALAKVLAVLIDLSRRTELWSAADFAPPDSATRQARYLIREDADRSFALYLNVMRRGKRTPIHDHTTWACIAAVEGSEHNHLYKRLDDGTREGYAEVVEDGVRMVRPGEGIALMPDDIHAVEIVEDEVIRHLHFYGRALETLSARRAYDPQSRSYRTMGIGVPTRRLQ